MTTSLRQRLASYTTAHPDPPDGQQQQLYAWKETVRDLHRQLADLLRAYNENNTHIVDDLFIGNDQDMILTAETIWGQLPHPVSLLNKSLAQLVREDPSHVRLLTDESNEKEQDDESDPSESDDDNASESENDDDDSDSASEDDSETRRIKARMARAMDDMESDENSATNSTNDDVSLEDPAKETLNDGFFDIQEMEAFADEEEDYLPEDAHAVPKPKKKRSLHQRQREGESESEDDDDEEETRLKRKKYRADEDIDALWQLYQVPDDNKNDTATNLTASDLFGPPKRKWYDKWNAKVHQDDDASWNEYNFEEQDEATGWRDDDNEEEHSDVDDAPTTQKQSAHSKQDQRLADETTQLEQEMLSEKPWQMTGEAKGASRPVNSLLQGTPEFERATKMAPMITAERTADLETVLKTRILAEDWDDVVPRELPDVGWHKKRGELPEVSQEKSKLGLGELYEREYLKKATGYDVDAVEKQTEEDKAKGEMKTLFANLCSKLDALSNYHYAPRPIADEANLQPSSKPAIAMEEALPLHTSDARAAAPHEVFAASGVLVAASERTPDDRKRLRQANKAARRKQRRAQEADAKLVSRLQPFNNPYEKRKAMAALSHARAKGKVTDGEVDQNDKYGASTTFFRRLQSEVQSSLAGTAATKAKEEEPRKRSSAYKL